LYDVKKCRNDGKKRFRKEKIRKRKKEWKGEGKREGKNKKRSTPDQKFWLRP